MCISRSFQEKSMAGVDGAAMKPSVWLRIAAVLQALGTIGHNLETLTTMPTHGP